MDGHSHRERPRRTSRVCKAELGPFSSAFDVYVLKEIRRRVDDVAPATANAGDLKPSVVHRVSVPDVKNAFIHGNFASVQYEEDQAEKLRRKLVDHENGPAGSVVIHLRDIS